MDFKKNNSTDKFFEGFGRVTGFLFSYFLFTTILYFIFVFMKKLPDGWNYFYIIGITIFISFFGYIIRRILR